MLFIGAWYYSMAMLSEIPNQSLETDSIITDTQRPTTELQP